MCLSFPNEQVASLHMMQTQWMLNLLLFVVPDHSEVQHQEPCSEAISSHTLDENAKCLIKKLGQLSSYLTRYRCMLQSCSHSVDFS